MAMSTAERVSRYRARKRAEAAGEKLDEGIAKQVPGRKAQGLEDDYLSGPVCPLLKRANDAASDALLRASIDLDPDLLKRANGARIAAGKAGKTDDDEMRAYFATIAEMF